MAAIDYGDLEDAKGIVLDRYPEVDEAELEALLAASACTDENGDPWYQPYLIAGHLIRSRWQQYKRLKSAAGSEIEYASPDAAFDALARLQDGLSVGKDCPLSWRWGLGLTFEAVL